MKVGTQIERTHIVSIKTVKRDAKTDKIMYETIESVDVYEASDAEVKEAVLRGLNAASKKA